MKIQLEQLDLMQPWPRLELRDGYHSMSVLVGIGQIPIGDVMARPVRMRVAAHERLARRIANKLAYNIIRALIRDGMSAGSDALMSHPLVQRFARLSGNHWERARDYVRDHLLLETGLPEPFVSWAREAQSATPFETPAITVAVCTRDRAEQLEGCIKHLQELDYPYYEILIVDNSSTDGPTRAVAEKLGVRYVREKVAGLSRARNAALDHSRTRWVAFTDDDCRPEKSWLKELVRPIQDSNCGCVTGLVLPAQLENAAEITFEIYGGLGRGFVPRFFDRGYLTASRFRPGQTWRIGAGANMLLDRDLVRRLGNYDIDMGPGGVGGCGEDTLVFYQILNSWRTIHYNPRAIVHHYHRSSDAALRKHIKSYAIGHAAYHTRVLFSYRDHRSLLQLIYYLPTWFARNLKRGIMGKTKYPFSLVFVEAKGTLLGPIQYSFAKLRRVASKWLAVRAKRPRPVRAGAPDFIELLPEPHYVAVPHQKRARVA